jgi:hypothetical protein
MILSSLLKRFQKPKERIVIVEEMPLASIDTSPTPRLTGVVRRLTNAVAPRPRPKFSMRIEDCEGTNSGNVNGATNVNDKYLGRSEPIGPTHPLYRRYA